MKKSYIKQKMYDGNICLGTWVFLPSPDVVEIIGLSGLDFIVIDMEHSPITYQKAASMIIAADKIYLTLYVRISELNGSNILRTLDTGAHGIQIPHVENKMDVQTIIKHSKYYPLGERGMAPSTKAGKYTLKTDKNILSHENDTTLIVLTLESEKSLDMVEEISKIEGGDVIYIGPYDLSQTMGLPGEVEHPLVLKKMELTFSKIHKYGKIHGSFANSTEQAQRLRDMGVNFLTVETDGTLLRNAFEKLKKTININNA